MPGRYCRINPNPPRCRGYCACNDKWDHWAETLPLFLHEHLSPKDLEGIREDLVIMLSCVAQHNADPVLRQWAASQLLQPVFIGLARQWFN
jgi:hypothetical protein